VHVDAPLYIRELGRIASDMSDGRMLSIWGFLSNYLDAGRLDPGLPGMAEVRDRVRRIPNVPTWDRPALDYPDAPR
jgi:hypothetical protein